MIINIQARESIDKSQWVVTLTLPNIEWAGKLRSGEYRLETPYSYGLEHMMSDKSVKKIMNSGELPNVRIADKEYVLSRVPDFRVMQELKDAFDVRPW
jgi:hypothetical protein